MRLTRKAFVPNPFNCKVTSEKLLVLMNHSSFLRDYNTGSYTGIITDSFTNNLLKSRKEFFKLKLSKKNQSFYII